MQAYKIYGVCTVKVFKKDNKFLIYLPYEVVEQLHIADNDEVDFFKYSNNAFLFAKKADVAALLSSGKKSEKISISNEELVVLKKLDTLRYPARDEASVDKLLNKDEKKVLDRLIERKLVVLFNDEKRKQKLYSISKYVYDNFLMRKKPGEASTAKAEPEPVPPERAWGEVYQSLEIKQGMENKDVESLEKNGYVVLQTEAEASVLSLAISESIRQGQVIGIRAFNKKYYIMLKDFFDKNSAKVLKCLKDGPKSVADIAKSAQMGEDAVRSILYFMAEQGDVTENRKDVFDIVK